MNKNNRDIQYLDTLRDYYADHHVLPSYTKVGLMTGLKSTSSVSAFIGRMKEAGYLSSAPDRRLQPGARFFERDVVDVVQAGFPAMANDLPIDGLNIDSHLIDEPSRTLLFEIKGESMVGRGLLPDDYVVVKKGCPARTGDIVVAIVDNEYTVKTLAHDGKDFYLKAANPDYPDIRATNHLEIFGLVTGSFRRF